MNKKCEKRHSRFVKIQENATEVISELDMRIANLSLEKVSEYESTYKDILEFKNFFEGYIFDHVRADYDIELPEKLQVGSEGFELPEGEIIHFLSDNRILLKNEGIIENYYTLYNLDTGETIELNNGETFFDFQQFALLNMDYSCVYDKIKPDILIQKLEGGIDKKEKIRLPVSLTDGKMHVLPNNQICLSLDGAALQFISIEQEENESHVSDIHHIENGGGVINTTVLPDGTMAFLCKRQVDQAEEYFMNFVKRSEDGQVFEQKVVFDFEQLSKDANIPVSSIDKNASMFALNQNVLLVRSLGYSYVFEKDTAGNFTLLNKKLHDFKSLDGVSGTLHSISDDSFLYHVGKSLYCCRYDENRQDFILTEQYKKIFPILIFRNLQCIRVLADGRILCSYKEAGRKKYFYLEKIK